MFNGGSIGFYSGDMRLFNDDIRQLKPTMIPAVPNVLNRMYDKVNYWLKEGRYSTVESRLSSNLAAPGSIPSISNIIVMLTKLINSSVV